MLKYKYNDRELSELLKSIVIIIDTREKKVNHITKFFDKNNIRYISRKLDYGDYGAILPANKELGVQRDIYINDVVIERKASLNELSSNFTRGRSQFENEMLRAKGNSCKTYLLIENADYGKIVEHKYPTQYNPRSFIASLSTFQARYDLSVIYMPSAEFSGSFIYQTLVYHVREKLNN